MIADSSALRASDEEFAWYVVHIHSRHEAKVQSSLQARGLEVFLPRISMRSRRRDRFQLLDVPLFPGYLFVYSNLSPWAYNGIIRHSGVVRILGRGSHCTPVAPDILASIQSILESNRSINAWPHSVPGQKVRVVAGLLCGAIGTIRRCKPGKQRLVVGVELLGRSIAVDLEEDCVEPVS